MMNTIISKIQLLFCFQLLGSISIANPSDSILLWYDNRNVELSMISDYEELFTANTSFIQDSTVLNYDRIYNFKIISVIEYLDKKKWDAALGVINMVITNGHLSDFIFNLRGLLYMKKQMYESALADFDKAIQINKNFALAYFNRGNIYEEKGLLERAFLDYTASIRLNEQFVLAYYNRGRINLQMGELENSIIDFNRAIEINPDLYLAYNDRGIVHNYIDQYNLALKDFDNAIKINPQYALAFFNKGNLLNKQGLYELAINAYNNVVKIEPDNAGTYYNIGNSYALNHDTLAALSSYSMAIKVDSNYSIAYYNKAFLEEMIGEKNTAVNSYIDYIKKAPESDIGFIDFAKYRIKSLRDVKIHISVLFAQNDSIATVAYSNLKNGEQFGEIVKKYSTGFQKDRGGAIGWFNPGDLRSELDIIAVNLQTGEFSNIIKTSSGYFILMKTGEQYSAIDDFVSICQ